MTATVKLSVDSTALEAALSNFYAAFESLPEIGEAFVDLLDSGDELFRVDSDGVSTSLTSELIVRLHPSDAFLRLMSASGAGDIDLGILEHATSPVGVLDVSTTSGSWQ